MWCVTMCINGSYMPKKTNTLIEERAKDMNREWSASPLIKEVQFFQNRDLMPFRLAGFFLF